MENITHINRRDMDMYYTGSILPVSHPTIEGAVTGAIIQGILETGSGLYEDYSVIVKRCWMDGERLRENGITMRFNDFISDGLKKSHDELGYIHLPNTRPLWVTGRPCLNYKKGITRSRLKAYSHNGEYSLDHISHEALAANLYRPFEGKVSKDLCEYSSRLFYKGRIVARIEDGGYTILRKFSYLQSLIASHVSAPVRISNE